MTLKRVLVVDDELPLVRAICDYLSAEGWTCTGASTAVEALALLDSEAFQIVLTDISLGDERDTAGLEIAARARALNMPVVIMTGHEAAHYAEAASRLTPHFLRKPIALAELARDLARWTG